MKKLIGETFGFIRSGLAPNSKKLIHVTLTDTLGKPFKSSGHFVTDKTGKLEISESQFQGLIATAVSDRQAAFVVQELDNYSINIQSDDGTVK